MPCDARSALEREGYVQGINTPAPSVISINTTLSGLAVTLFLQLLTDFIGESGGTVRLNYYITDAEVKRGTMRSEDQCICKKVRAFGDLKAVGTVSVLPC